MMLHYAGSLLCLFAFLGAEAARGSLARTRRPHTAAAPATAAAKKKNVTPKAAAKSVCSSRDDYQFQRQLLLTFKGRPGSISAADLATVQRSIIQSYNQAATCSSNVRGGFLRLSQVIISRNQVDSFGASVTNTDSNATSAASITQTFTVVATVRGACRGCQETPFHLFSTVASSIRRQQESNQMPSTTVSNTSRTKRRDIFSRAKPVVLSCRCPVPSRSSFVRALNRLILTSSRANGLTDSRAFTSSIDRLLRFSELDRYSPCSPTETTFETFLTLDLFTGGGTNVSNATNLTQAQYRLLEQAVLQSYNNLNALSTGSVCDTSFSVLTNVETVASSNNSVSSTNISRRLIQNISTSAVEEFRFSIKGKCRGCTGNPPNLFHVGAVQQRRQLDSWPIAIKDDAQPVHPSSLEGSWHQDDQTDVTATRIDKDDHNHRQLPVVSRQCFCPVGATEFRLLTRDEFVQAFNRRIGLLTRGGLINIVRSASGTVQDVPVPCSDEVKYFYDIIEVEFAGDVTNISSSDANLLGQALLTSYNTLAQQFCDPLFRRLQSVEVLIGIAAETNRRLLVPDHHHYDAHEELLGRNPQDYHHHHRRLAKPTFVPCPTVGTCRGNCKPTSLSFSDSIRPRATAPMPAAALGISLALPPSSLPRSSANRWHKHKHRMGRHRLLQQDNETATCYCNLNSLGNRTPTRAEFAVAYNQTLATLGIPLSVISVSESANITLPPSLPTASPTISFLPTISPQPTISPFPSSIALVPSSSPNSSSGPSSSSSPTITPFPTYTEFPSLPSTTTSVPSTAPSIHPTDTSIPSSSPSARPT